MGPKVILITGASSGIGKASAELLSARGHRVYGTSRSLSFAPEEFLSLQMDVTDDTSVKQAIDAVIQREGRLDVVVNNAGYGLAGSIEDTTTAEAQRQLDVNFMGAFRVSRAALEQMRRQRGGLIINLSSLAGLFGLPFQGVYSASKFALEGLSESLRYEVGAHGIRVVLIEPGDIKTNITANRALVDTANSAYREQFQTVLNIIEREERNGAEANRIAKLVCKIVETNSGRIRYTAGHWSQRLAVAFKRIAPFALFEWVLGSWYGVAPPKRARATGVTNQDGGKAEAQRPEYTPFSER